RTVLLRRVRLVLLVMIAIGLAVAVHVVPRAGVFDVAHVEIVGASAVSDLDVRQRIDPALRRATIFTVDQGDVARRVRALPFVRSVHIERHVPGGLGIRIVEYRPLAVACTATSCWLLSPDGRILTRAHGSEWRGRVPVVQLLAHKVHAGMRLPDEPGVDVLRALPATSTLAFTSIAATRYSVVGRTTDGVEVRFGRPEAWSTKVAVAQRLIEPLSAKGVEIAYVDVSVPDHTAVCLRDNPVCRDAETVDEVANAHAKRVEALKAIAKMRKGGAPKDAIDEATYRMNNPTAVATAPPTPVTESAVGRAETTQTPTAPQSAHLNAFEAAANGT
ncbi:MAG: Polypeptide-transport-associated domain protein FtsQ-type, partial [Thermoleophilia bacterium]|nr:Polypeptide-transport-associated domain protein FtsQ-type [Thermoleophilia bacterium]